MRFYLAIAVAALTSLSTLAFAQPAQPSYSDALKKMAAWDKIKRDRDLKVAANEKAKDDAARLANLTVRTQSQVQGHRACPQENHIAPDVSFKTPIVVPNGKVWPEAVAAFTDAGYSNVAATTTDLRPIAYETQFPRPTHVMTITSIIARDTGWKGSELIQTLGKLAGVLARCGIAVRAATIVADLPRKTTIVDREIEKSIVALTPVKRRPALYFIDRNTDVIGADGSGEAFAWDRSSCSKFLGGKQIQCGTAWFGRDVVERKMSDGKTANVDWQAVDGDRLVLPIFHELAHLMGDRGHTDAGDPPNILQGVTNRLSVDLTAEQCAAFKANRDYVEPIAP